MVLLNPSPKDALGRVLAEGDGALLVLNGPIVFRVAEIAPVLDPRQPPGLMQIHLFATASFTVKAGARHTEILRVGTVEELGPLPFEMSAIERTAGKDQA